MPDKLEALYQALAQRALEAREAAYCPYSHFAVGAALLCDDGSVYAGCNIENAGLTAFFRAVADGHRKFLAIAIAGGPAGEPPAAVCAPCGVCRQVMAEFCGPDFEILLAGPESCTRTTLGALLPMAFGPGNLQ